MTPKARNWLVGFAICAGLWFVLDRYRHPTPDPLQAQFIKAKHADARRLAALETNPVPSQVWAFFRAAERNDIKSATNVWNKLTESEYSPKPNRSPLDKLWDDFKLAAGIRAKPSFRWEYPQPLWTPIYETGATLNLFRTSDPNWIRHLGEEVVAEVGTNGVYLAGTVTGRMTARCVNETMPAQKHCQTVALYALADQSYMEYLRQTCGHSLSIPTPQDQQEAFEEYMRAAQRRLAGGARSAATSRSILPVSKQPAVMEINANLAQQLFRRNLGREFFTDDAFSAEWMLPFMEPSGPILRLRIAPLESIDADLAQQDRNYWKRLVNEWLGDWLGEGTTPEDIRRFCESVYLRKDLSGFNGNDSFVADQQVRAAYARLRASSARLYHWHSGRATVKSEQQRLRAEADFAYRQALALCPSLPEASESYASFLLETGRKEDARAVLRLWSVTSPDNVNAREALNLMEQARELRDDNSKSGITPRDNL